MQKKISIFSFFSGIGILDLAFEKNGYNIVFVNEYDNLFIESYRYARMQMNLRAPIYGYRNDSAERYARRRGKKNLLALIAQEREKGNLVGFIGGPPCPDFSVAGKNAGVDGENGRLTKIYFDIICRCHPDFFLFENVKGLVKTEKHRAFYKEMMMKVQANDYVIAENVLNALAYGVPQFRERVFMVGIHKKIYQNEPNTLIFKWDKHALFNTENVLTRTWPKEREFATDRTALLVETSSDKENHTSYVFIDWNAVINGVVDIPSCDGPNTLHHTRLFIFNANLEDYIDNATQFKQVSLCFLFVQVILGVSWKTAVPNN